MTATQQHSDYLRGVALMAANTPESYEQFETYVLPTLSADDAKSVEAAILVHKADKAATVLEKWLIDEKDRTESFKDDLTSFIIKANELAELMPDLFKLTSLPGGGGMARKVVFPTKVGPIEIKVK